MYIVLAENLLQGRGLQVFEPFMGVTTYALFPPLYPTVLAAWGWGAGLSTWSLVALNLLVDISASAMIVILGQRLGNGRAGLFAAWLYLIWPSTLLSSAIAQKEGLCVLLVVAIAFYWVKIAQSARPAMRDCAALGICSGLLALTQPGEIPLAALFGVVALTKNISRLFVPTMLAIPVAATAIMLPWWLRNSAVFGTFVPLTSAGGYGLWIGNNPSADGHWMPPPASLHGLPEIAFGKAAGLIALEWVQTHPFEFLRLTAAKLARAWGVAEFGVSRLANARPNLSVSLSGSFLLLSQLSYLIMLATAAFRAVRRANQTAHLLVLLACACIVQTFCFGGFFEFGERHREFATPFLLLITVWGLPLRQRIEQASTGHRQTSMS
jgi:hypothetical protein